MWKVSPYKQTQDVLNILSVRIRQKKKVHFTGLWSRCMDSYNTRKCRNFLVQRSYYSQGGG